MNTNRVASDNTYYLVGPLNLNLRSKQAGTIMGVKLTLNDREFDTLHMLAIHEGKSFAAHDIWQGGDADIGLECLRSKITEAGEGFMWIERDPNGNYAFKTRWGRDYTLNEEGENTDINLKPFNKSVKQTKSRGGIIRYSAVAAPLLAAAVLALVILTPNAVEIADDYDTIALYDVQVPLGEMPAQPQKASTSLLEKAR